jgi:hypothetical protein
MVVKSRKIRCSTHDELRNEYQFWLDNFKVIYRLGDLGVYERILLKSFKKIGCEGVSWIQLTQDRFKR